MVGISAGPGRRATCAPRTHRVPATGKALVVAFLMMGLLGAGPGAPAMAAGATDAAGTTGGVAENPGPGGYFELNMGQFPEHVRFVVHGAGVHAFLTDDGAAFVLHESPADGTTDALGDPLADPLANPFAHLGPPEPAAPTSLFAVFLRFEDAEPGPMEGAEQKQGISNHFIGNDPDKWVTDVPTYARVVQRGVWPGIDIEWHIAPEGLKFDAVVHPGADSGKVRFTLPGAVGLSLGAAGDLVIATSLGELVKEAPYSYQDLGDGTMEVPSRYVLDGGAVGFEVDGHDASRVLVIDPLLYSTYLGGSIRTEGNAIAVDDSGHAYVTGWTNSPDYPTKEGYQSAAGSIRVFVTKLAPGGDALVYSSVFGDGGRGNGIAVDAAGSAIVVGYTRVLPVHNAHQGTANDITAFVTKFTPAGNALVYSTYLGGIREDHGYDVAVDPEGNAYVTGMTASPDFPTTPLAFRPALTGITSAFVTKFTDGGALEYSTYLGGSSSDVARGIDVDAEGYAYVAGLTQSLDFPTQNAYQRTMASASGPSMFDGFLTKLTPLGNDAVYSTYLGGSGQDYGFDVAVDGAGSAYVAVLTYSSDIRTTPGAFQPNHPGGSTEAFVAKFTPEGDDLDYGTWIGGSGWENRATGIAVDAAGSAYVVGWTESTDFPVKNPYMDSHPGGRFAVVVSKLAPAGDALLWSTYLGGTGWDMASAVALDAAGSAYVTGHTRGFDFPTKNAFRDSTNTKSFAEDAFVSKLYGIHVDFDWDDPCPREPVAFHDRSFSYAGAPIARSEWDFGEGGTVRVLDPWQDATTYTYLANGTYDVSLTVIAADGDRNTATATLTVPYCPPPNHPPSLRPLPCVVSSPGQQVSFRVEATVPVFPGDPASYSELSFFGEGLPAGATLHQDGDFAARFAWDVGPADTYTFVVHVEDGEGLRDSGDYCIRSLPDKPAPLRGDDSGDGVQNWHDACPHAKNPDQSDAGGDGPGDPCFPQDEPEEPGEAPEEGPPPVGCPSQPVGPREVTARWTDGAVQITWRSDSWCPPDHFLVWNGTGHHLVAFVPATAGVHHVVLNLDPWPEPHQYFVQAMGADEGLFFDPTRAVASNLIDPAGCLAEGPRSAACLPAAADEEPAAPVEPAEAEAVAPADSPSVGLVAAAAALVVSGLLALLWRLRHAPWVVHLVSRLGRDDVLDHPVRKEIMDLVTGEPGIHYAEIRRRTGKNHGTARHHLRVLEAAGLVTERRTGRYLCYWPPEGPGPGLQELGALLRTDVAQRLLRLLIHEPGLGVPEVARRLQTPPNTIRYHLQRFEAGGLARLERRPGRTMVHPGGSSKKALAAWGSQDGGAPSADQGAPPGDP